MLKKLRVKFILMMMSFAVLLLGSIFGLIYYFTASNLAQDSGPPCGEPSLLLQITPFSITPLLRYFLIKRSTRISCICRCNRVMSSSWFNVSKYFDRSTDTAYLYPCSAYSFTF